MSGLWVRSSLSFRTSLSLRSSLLVRSSKAVTPSDGGTSRHTAVAARVAAAGAALALVLTGCTASSGTAPTGSGATATAATDGATPQSSNAVPGKPARLTISPTDTTEPVSPDTPVTVEVADGKLDEVEVKSKKGAVLTGTQTETSWTSDRNLTPDTSYTVTATATGTDGKQQTEELSFDTLTPGIDATYRILYDKETVGIGMPVSIQFDSQVTTKAQRAAVEKQVELTVTPEQEGAWGWLDNRQLMWRPKAYFTPGTTVKVKTKFAGLQTGPTKWVGKDDSGGFTVGSAMVSTVNIKTHHMTVTKDGKVLRTIPVSSGRPGPETETRSGTKVIISKEDRITMDSATIGIPKGSPGYYSIDTDYNLRVTWTGEFLHSAPWSTGAQGNSNVSHGCVNMAPANAQWMYEQSKPGDIVKFVGSNRPFLPTDGIGVWTYTFAQWQKQSAA